MGDWLVAVMPASEIALEGFFDEQDNADMESSSQIELHGHVKNGVVVLDGGESLPEGAAVRVTCALVPPLKAPPVRKPAVLPIFPYAGPPDIELTNDEIAEILNREDASA
jgi:hypothetical protein